MLIVVAIAVLGEIPSPTLDTYRHVLTPKIHVTRIHFFFLSFL